MGGLPKATRLETEAEALTPSSSLEGQGRVCDEGLHSTVSSSCVYMGGRRG